MDVRAQTTVDFAIAMGVFLVALTTVIAFMPEMTGPFTGGQQNPLIADRLAAQLTEGQLGDPRAPAALNAACTMHFFNESNDSDGNNPCPSFQPGASVQKKLGVDETVQANVTIRKNVTGGASPDIVCATPGAESFSSLSSCSGEPMMVGPTPPDVSGSVTIGRRYAVLNGESVFVVVKVWT